MSEIPASKARAKWAHTLDAAKRSPVTVTEYGRASVVILSAETGRRALDALEREQAVAGIPSGADAGTTARPAVKNAEGTSPFVSGADVAHALRELGPNTRWAAELAEARAELEQTDPWLGARK